MESPTFRQLKIYYYRYKDTPYFAYGVMCIIVMVCILQLFFVIIPVWNQLMVVQNEVEKVETNIKTMEENSAYITSLDPASQLARRNIVLAALPITKDYAGVYNAVITGASQTGVSLSGFSYDVGSLDPAETDGLVAQMSVNLAVNGSLASINDFVQTLEEVLPLSEVRGYSGDTGASNVEIAFYYGGQQLPIAVDNTKPLKPLTPEKEQLLNSLSSFVPPVEPVTVVEDTSSSASAFSQPPF